MTLDTADDSNFCSIPWGHRIVNLTQPWYKFCCVSQMIPVENISHIESSPQLSRVKQQLLQNTQPSECSTCFNAEKTGSPSFRKVSNYTDIKKIPNGIQALEINLENTCNLRCLSCGPTYSSRWGEGTHTDELLDSNLKALLELIELNKHSIQRVVISGGEPSIIPNFYRIIDCVKNSLPNYVEIFINTNGMFNERLGNKFVETIKELSKTHVTHCYWSCDGYGELGEFLRDGLNYEHFKNNIKKIIRETSANHKLQITTSNLNLTSQIDLIEDIFSIKVMPVKVFYLVHNKNFMLPSILGSYISNIVTNIDIEKMKDVAPEYYSSAYTELVRNTSKLTPNLPAINFLRSKLKDYSLLTKKSIPEETQQMLSMMP